MGKIGAVIAGGILLSAIIYFKPSETTEAPVNTDSKHRAYAEWMLERLQDPETGKIPDAISSRELLFAKTLPKQDQSSRSEALIYDARGPANVGGRTRGFAYDVTNNQTLLAGGVNGGVWKSTNNGLTWRITNAPDQMHNVSFVLQDERSGKESTWYYSTGEGGYPSSGHHGSAYVQGNGIYKSTDNGESWELMESTAPNNPKAPSTWSLIWNMAIDNSNTTQDEIYVAANGAIMRSEDGGQTWEQELGGGVSNGYAWVDVTSTGVVYAAVGNPSSGLGNNIGIWRSTDGKSWVNIGTGSVPGNMQRCIFSIAPSLESVVYFLMRSPGSGVPADPTNPGQEYASLYKYEFLSGDGTGGGGRWTNLSSNIPSDQNAYFTFDTQDNYNMAIAVKPNNFNTVFIGGTNLFRSTDGFSTKNNIVQLGGYNPDFAGDPETYRYPDQHPDQHYMAFQKNNGSEMMSATDGGLHFTRDCMASKVVWENRNNGYTTTQFYTIALDHITENSVLLGGCQDNGTQYTHVYSLSNPWVSPVLSDGSYCAVSSGNANTGAGIYYMSSQYGATYKVEMDATGNRSRRQRFEFPGTQENYRFINPFCLDYNDNNTMYMAYRESSGNSKIKRHMALSSIPLNDGNSPSASGWGELPFTFAGRVTCLKSSRTNPTARLYVCTTDGTNGYMYRVDGANTSTPTMTQLSLTFPYRKGVYISDLVVDPDNADEIIMCYSNYNRYSIYHSTDAGSSWDGVAGNLEDTLPSNFPPQALGQGDGPSVRTLAIAKTDDGVTYFAGTSTGLYAAYKLDGHNTVWVEQASAEIGNTVVEKLEIRNSDNYLGIATHGKGMYTTYVTTSQPNVFTESDYARHLNALKAYPNPSSGFTQLKLETEVRGEFSVSVFNLQGGEVHQERVQMNDTSLPEIELDLNSLEAGVYFVQVKSGSYDHTIKLIKE